MSLRNFHVDANVTDDELLKWAHAYYKKLVGSFRQAAANGHFKFGGITLQDHDLNRVHSIVTEIDSRRLFYVCGDDEIPQYAMQSLYEARKSIMQESKGVWADPSCELIVQDIIATLADYCSKAEKLASSGGNIWETERVAFMKVMTEMRLNVWLLVSALKSKLGSVIQPRNLPPELFGLVSEDKV